MNIHPTALFGRIMAGVILTSILLWIVVKTFLDEAICLGKPLEEIFVFDVVNWNMQVLVAAR